MSLGLACGDSRSPWGQTRTPRVQLEPPRGDGGCCSQRRRAASWRRRMEGVRHLGGGIGGDGDRGGV